MNYIDRFESDEVLLITSLTLCFGMALAAYQLGLSAAGAFLVGMILGNTELSERISRIMNPLRDMFAALFFVSLGMLLDIPSIGDYLVPALIISGVFIVGKVLADTIGTLLAGHDGETALRVGTGMPQLGEFSLAMVKTGVEHGTVGAFLSPVVTMAAGITALLCAFILRSSDMLSRFIGRASPSWLRQFCAVTFVWLTASRGASILGRPLARRVRCSVQRIMLNTGIIAVVIGLGTFALEFSHQLSEWFGLSVPVLGFLTGGVALALCVPAGVAIWRNLDVLTEEVMGYFLPPWRTTPENVTGHNLKKVIRNSILIVVLLLPAIWSIPFIIHLFPLGSVFAPLTAVALIGITPAVAVAAFQIHGTLEDTFRRTLLRGSHHYRYDEHQLDSMGDDSHLYADDGNYYEQFSASDD